jgi:hypothetical protein
VHSALVSVPNMRHPTIAFVGSHWAAGVNSQAQLLRLLTRVSG